MLGEIALSWYVRTKGKGEHYNLVFILIVSLPYKGAAIPAVKQRAASLADECRCQSAGLGAGANVHSESLSVRVGKLPVVDMEAGACGPHV